MNQSGAALLVVASILLTADCATGGECMEYFKRADFDAAVAKSRADSTFVPQFDALFCWDEPESIIADMMIDALRDSTVSKRMKVATIWEAGYGGITAAWPGIEPYIESSDEELRRTAWSAVVNLLNNGRGPELQCIDWRVTFFRVYGVPTAELQRDCLLFESPDGEERPALRALPRGTIVFVKDYDLGCYAVSVGSDSGYVDERCIQSGTPLGTLRSLSSHWHPGRSR